MWFLNRFSRPPSQLRVLAGPRYDPRGNQRVADLTHEARGRAAPHLAIVRRFSRSQGSGGISRWTIDKPASTTRQAIFVYLSIPPSGVHEHEPAAPRHVMHERGSMRIIRAGCNTDFLSAIRIIDCSS